MFTFFLQFDCQNLEGNIGAGKEKMLNVHSENHGRVRTTSNSFLQVRRHTSIALEEQEGCDTSELSLDVKEEVENVDSNIPENRPEEVDGEVKIEVKERRRMMMKRMLIIFANSVELYFRVRLL